MNLEQVIGECDALRECMEGVGLSDGLISCIELAYNEGRKAASEAVTVYFGDKNLTSSEEVATFVSEELYIACLPALSKQAKQCNMIVTESIKEREP